MITEANIDAVAEILQSEGLGYIPSRRAARQVLTLASNLQPAPRAVTVSKHLTEADVIAQEEARRSDVLDDQPFQFVEDMSS